LAAILALNDCRKRRACGGNVLLCTVEKSVFGVLFEAIPGVEASI